MTSVDKVKALCKEKKIPISKLERDLGFGNGYIGQLKKGVFPHDRLLAIAEYLGVTAFCLMGVDEPTEKSPAPEGAELTETQRKAFDLIMQLDEKSLRRMIKIFEAVLEEHTEE